MFKIQDKLPAYTKIGINEVIGLKEAMKNALLPVQELLKESVYWNDSIELVESEYKSRDGFIPYLSNHGGIEISELIPKCEVYSFPIIPVTECEDDDIEHHECNEHCDHALRVWLKFEGLDNGIGKFYLVCSGGNNDAPYFRNKHQPVLFETEFTADGLDTFKNRSKIAVNLLLNKMRE